MATSESEHTRLRSDFPRESPFEPLLELLGQL
jgi:hypothetical protein